MSKSVGVLLVVLDLDFVVNLLEDVESELEFISGSVGETLSFHMGSEFLVHVSWSLVVVEETLETEDGGGFGKMHHL